MICDKTCPFKRTEKFSPGMCTRVQMEWCVLTGESTPKGICQNSNKRIAKMKELMEA